MSNCAIPVEKRYRAYIDAVGYVDSVAYPLLAMAVSFVAKLEAYEQMHNVRVDCKTGLMSRVIHGGYSEGSAEEHLDFLLGVNKFVQSIH